jgi:mercuric ion transport protein
MREAEGAEPTRVVPWRGYAWAALAAVTCPCHLPLLALLLSGTAAGAALGEHQGIAFLVLSLLFLLFLAAAMRSWRARP